MQPGFVELELTRSADDRRRFDLADAGSLTLQGRMSQRATAETTGGERFAIERPGFWRRAIEATDASGMVAGRYDPRGGFRRGGRVAWRDREYLLRPASAWRQRYALVDGDREVALLDGKGWGSRPVKMGVDPSVDLDPALLLFAAFVVNRIAGDAASTAAAGASAAAVSAS